MALALNNLQRVYMPLNKETKQNLTKPTDLTNYLLQPIKTKTKKNDVQKIIKKYRMHYFM